MATQALTVASLGSIMTATSWVVLDTNYYPTPRIFLIPKRAPAHLKTECRHLKRKSSFSGETRFSYAPVAPGLRRT